MAYFFMMKAVVLRSPKKLELVDIPQFPMTEANHVLVKVEACGICGSDLRYWQGQNPWALHTLGRHVNNPPNLVMGHEFAGEVAGVNSKEYENLIGESVVVQSYRSCGICSFCTSGRQNLCRDMIHIGHAQGWGEMGFYPGAYSEYCIGWADMLHKIDGPIGYDEASMADILCVAVHAIGRAQQVEGKDIFCIGGGPAGLSSAQVAMAKGARSVVISDPSPVARRVISHYDGITVVDPADSNAPEIVLNSGKSGKFSVVIDSVGDSDTFSTAMDLLADSGTYINLAVHDTEVTLNLMKIGTERNLTTSSNAFYRDIDEAVELLNSGKINVKPWITHHFRLEEFEEAFALLLSEPKQAYKVVFEPWNPIV